MRIGFHFPFSGGVKTLKTRIKKSRGNTFQIFARGLRGGELHTLKEKDMNDLFVLQQDKNIKPAIIHAPYVYNLANLDLEDDKKVVEDLTYAIQFRAPYYVVHPGRYKDMHPLQALENVRYQLWDILNQTEWMGQILVKNMAGAGTEMAYDLREWKELITFHPQVKGALDLGRLYASGYNFVGEDNARKLVENIEAHIGWDNIKVVYVNDSNRTLGSRKKDSTPPPLGEGTISFNGFKHILSQPEVQEKIWIVENSPEDQYYMRSMNFLLSLRE